MRAIVFDLDGTLVDTAPDLHASLNHVLTSHGRRTVALEEAAPMIGGGAVMMITRGYEVTGRPVDKNSLPELYEMFLDHYERICTERSLPYQGVFEALNSFRDKGVKLGVCTNKPGRMADIVLNGLGFAGYFSSVAGADRYPVRKPHPDHLLGVLKELDVTPTETVMVGDSMTDVNTARAAGTMVVAVTFGYSNKPAHQFGADAVIDHFSELRGAINGLC